MGEFGERGWDEGSSTYPDALTTITTMNDCWWLVGVLGQGTARAKEQQNQQDDRHIKKNLQREFEAVRCLPNSWWYRPDDGTAGWMRAGVLWPIIRGWTVLR